jgi:outer membrane murein-binding lipoprotein Lpp
VVLAVVAGLLLAGAGVIGYLWWTTATELDATRTDLQAQVEELTGTVDARDSEIDQLGQLLQQARDELAEAQTALEGTENMVELLEEQQGVIRECIVGAGELNEAIESGQTPSEADLEAVDEACEAAGQILGL